MTQRDRATALRVRRALAVLVLSLALPMACGKSSQQAPIPSATPTPAPLDPDVPRWRGGCFFEGAPGKIVNARPSPDVRLFGGACATPVGQGGLVFLDRYDPASGRGDVTILSSAPGSAPVVVAKDGGAGGVVDGGTGARLNASETKLLTLRQVGFLTGELVEVDLPGGGAVRPIAAEVRVENYDYLAGDAILYVGNYDASSRTGDVVFRSGGVATTLGQRAGRFAFDMYRLSPDRSAVAFLLSYDAELGGQLVVQRLPPTADPAFVRLPEAAGGVVAMDWTRSGQLVYRLRNADGVTTALEVWDPASGTRSPLAPSLGGGAVDRATVAGDAVVFATGWSVLTQRSQLRAVRASDGAPLVGPVPSASLGYSTSAPAQGGGAVAWVALGGGDPFTGQLFAAPLAPAAAPTAIDASVAANDPVAFSASGRYLAYVRGLSQPRSGGSGNAQPGIADELLVAPVAGGAPFRLAARASPQIVSWDRGERFVAGIAEFDPARNRGQLAVARTSDGAPLLSTPLDGVSALRFGFGVDGAYLAALRAWDDALQRGELVLVATDGPRAWQPTPIDADVTFHLPPRGDRVVYGVRGGGRDGLWLGAAP